MLSLKIFPSFRNHLWTRKYEGRPVEQQFLESNLVLNAKTVRNNNSSRFGKSMEHQFDQSCRITGAAIRTTFKEICPISHLAPPIITFIDGPAATPLNSAPTASRAKGEEIERRKTEVEGKIQAHIGCVEGETKRLA